MLAKNRYLILISFIFYFISWPIIAEQWVKGIYITQSTLENTQRLNYLIKHAKSGGINTFVIDLNVLTKRYQKNIQLVLDNNLKYVARIVVFPDGATHDQLISLEHRAKKYKLVEQAIALGASEIQLDYIRYNTARPASAQNAKNVHSVITWFKERVDQYEIPLQIDVFGITSFGEEKHIGQNVALFANTVDVICPMNYPSHFEPFRKHAVTPYETVYNALTSMQAQFTDKKPKIYNYIELSNYRYPLSTSQRLAYIKAQIKATHDAGAHGWYAWSPNNHYDHLFTVLRSMPSQQWSVNTIRNENF